MLKESVQFKGTFLPGKSQTKKCLPSFGIFVKYAYDETQMER